jgi:hypothetical protein
LTLILNGTDNSATTPAVTGTDTDTGVYYPAANQVALATNGTLALLVDASQNIGVGVTPSAWKSNYKAIQIGVAGNLVGRTDNNTVLYLSTNWYVNSSNQDIYQNTGASALYSQNAGSHIWYNAPSGTAGNAVTFTQALTLNTNGALALQGASTSATGVGITFPATQSASSDANTLDDYEEGTWTPVFSAGGITGTSITYSGTYTKIGRVVSVSFRAQSASGNINVGSYVAFSGLPFTVGVKGCGSATTEDIDIFASLGFAEASGTSFGLSKCGNGTTSDLNAMVTFFV